MKNAVENETSLMGNCKDGMEIKKLTHFINHQGWIAAGKPPGGYWIAKGTKSKCVLSCPYCEHFSSCDHQILCENPLTLKPSVVEHGCGHHFNVDNGYAQ